MEGDYHHFPDQNIGSNIEPPKKKSLTEESRRASSIASKAKQVLEAGFKLPSPQVGILIKEIETNKKQWLREADASIEPWITRKIKVAGRNVKIKIYKKDRKNAEKTGQIDIDLEQIGKGGGGIVFKTLHYETGRIGATKVMKGEVRNPERIERIGRKVRRESSVLDDPRITHVAKGRNMAVRQAEEGKHAGIKVRLTSKFYNEGQLEGISNMSPKEKFQVCYDVLKGLSSIHKSGKIHRDVKRENILVHKRNVKPDRPGVVKRYRIADFDLVELKEFIGYSGTKETLAPLLLC